MGYHSAPNSRPETFGDYMANDALSDRKYPPAKQKHMEEPSGYVYFTQKFTPELSHFKKYLKKTYPNVKRSDFNKPINYKRFSTLEIYRAKKSKAKKQRRLKPGLFVTLLERNPDYLKYIVWDVFKIDLSRDEEEISIYPEKKKNEHIAKPKQKSKPSRKAKKTEDTESFKNFLHSINKIKTTSPTFDDVLPRMTNLKSMPTNPPTAQFNELERDLQNHDLESFLSHAKEDNENRQTGLFKARMNYEWSKERLSYDPDSFGMRTFFNPVAVPRTLIQRSCVQTADPSEIGKPGSRYLVLSKNGDQIVLDNLTFLNEKPFGNMYSQLSTFQGGVGLTSQISGMLSHGWKLLNGDEGRLVFVKQTKGRNLTLLSAVGILGASIAAVVIYMTHEKSPESSATEVSATGISATGISSTEKKKTE